MEGVAGSKTSCFTHTTSRRPLNRKLMKAYLMKESLERLWQQPNEYAAVEYLTQWIRPLRWQRLPAFEKFARMLLDHREGIFNYYHVAARSN